MTYPSPIRHLFAYGTLQHPDIISYVIGRIPDGEPGILHNFARYSIKGENFPGLLPKAESQTDGTLFRDIKGQEWTRLDEYESDLYERQTVELHLSSGERVKAEAYVIPPENTHFLTEKLWSLDEYKPES